jgi:hypothetical protein
MNGANGTHASGNGHHVNGHAAVDEVSDEDAPADDPAVPSPLHTGTDAYAGLGEGKRIFAPQTMSQTENYFRGNRLGGPMDWKLRLARAPMSVMIAGASAVLIVLLLIVYGLMSLHGSRKPTTSTPTPIITSNNRQPSLGSSHTQAGNESTPTRQLLPNQNHPASLRETTSQREIPTPAHIYGPGTVTRNLDLYYVIIATTPSEYIAQRNAKLIADNGVDVSIETQMSRSGRLLYRLISVQGASSTSDAQPLRKRIVEIGHLLPDFAKTRKAWDDATVMKWSSLLGAAARG